MYYRIYIGVVITALVMGFSSIANATDLEDAVASYNAEAACLQAAWDSFQAAQSAAYADVEDWLTNLHDYYDLVTTDEQLAALKWQAYLIAIDQFETQTMPPVEPAFDLLLASLEATAEQLQVVHLMDMADPNALVYATGQMHFELTSQPFLFWTVPETVDPTLGWMPYEFPELAVDDSLMHDFYVPLNLGVFLDFLGDMWDWIDLGLWFNRNKDTAYDINDAGSQKFYELCGYCAGNVQLNQLVDECFTEAGIENWCNDNYYGNGYEGTTPGYCDDTNMSDMNRNEAVQEYFECYEAQNLEKVKDVAEDYLSATWSVSLAWL